MCGCGCKVRPPQIGVRTKIWTCGLRACDPKKGHNSHLGYIDLWMKIHFEQIKTNDKFYEKNQVL